MAELRTLARPYARAAFEFADGQGQLAEWEKQLALLADLCADAKVASALDAPGQTSEQRTALLVGLLEGEGSTNLNNFVGVLSSERRIGLVSAIYDIFAQLKAEREKSVDVTVESAFELTAEQQTTLAETLKKTLSRQVDLTCAVDTDLLGGVRIHAGDTVIDASLRGRLGKLAEAMNS